MAIYTQQRGFTLVELVATLVLLGVLATVALARSVDLRDEAREAALEEQAHANRFSVMSNPYRKY